jgi:hypothetical protein
MSEKEIYPAVLESFYIYNPTLGESERTEHEKIIFFHPSDTSADEKQTQVGLSEGLVNFTMYARGHFFCSYSYHFCGMIVLMPDDWLAV